MVRTHVRNERERAHRVRGGAAHPDDVRVVRSVELRVCAEPLDLGHPFRLDRSNELDDERPGRDRPQPRGEGGLALGGVEPEPSLREFQDGAVRHFRQRHPEPPEAGRLGRRHPQQGEGAFVLLDDRDADRAHGGESRPADLGEDVALGFRRREQRQRRQEQYEDGERGDLDPRRTHRSSHCSPLPQRNGSPSEKVSRFRRANWGRPIRNVWNRLRLGGRERDAGPFAGEPGGGTGTDPQESNKNLAMGSTRRGEGAAVYRSSLPLVLALVVLMVLPAHGVAARTESSALPTMADAVGPHGGTAAPALNRAAPPMPSGGPPRALYPSH